MVTLRYDCCKCPVGEQAIAGDWERLARDRYPDAKLIDCVSIAEIRIFATVHGEQREIAGVRYAPAKEQRDASVPFDRDEATLYSWRAAWISE